MEVIRGAHATITMANRTVKGVKTVHGTDPQQLVEKIIRERVYESRYWKEECFGLSAELLVEKIVELKYIGGIFAGNVKATPFLCLVLKMLQLQPDKEIIVEFLKNDEYKYMRALAAIYLRLVGSSVEIYNYLEPLYCDYRKLRAMDNDGKFYLIHMDEFIDKLLRDDRACDIVLPLLQSRDILEETEQLDPKKSVLDEDLLEMIKQEPSSDVET